MDKAPTYQDLNRQKAEAAAVQSQVTQKENVAQNANSEAAANVNPILAEYLGRNVAPQGLTPVNPANQYAALANDVARSVPDQESYSTAMITAAMKGQVSAEDVLADSNVLDQAKVGLIKAIQQNRQNRGLGQIPQ